MKVSFLGSECDIFEWLSWHVQFIAISNSKIKPNLFSYIIRQQRSVQKVFFSCQDSLSICYLIQLCEYYKILLKKLDWTFVKWKDNQNYQKLAMKFLYTINSACFWTSYEFATWMRILSCTIYFILKTSNDVDR